MRRTSVLLDKAHLSIALLHLLLVLQLEVEGEEAGDKVDLDGEGDHNEPHGESNKVVSVHLDHLLFVGVRESELPIIVPSGEEDAGRDAAGDGGEEVEDCKEEDTSSPLKASSANAHKTLARRQSSWKKEEVTYGGLDEVKGCHHDQGSLEPVEVDGHVGVLSEPVLQNQLTSKWVQR